MPTIINLIILGQPTFIFLYYFWQQHISPEIVILYTSPTGNVVIFTVRSPLVTVFVTVGASTTFSASFLTSTSYSSKQLLMDFLQ